MADLVFPMHYRPRPYQPEVHRMWRTKRIGILVQARQTGKDMSGAIEMCDARLRRPKTSGLYIGTSNNDIRRILWNKTYPVPGGDNVHLLRDNVPPSMVQWRDTTMTGRFTNGSLLEVLGFYETGQGKSGVGTSFDDYFITELALFGREDPTTGLMPIIEQDTGNKRLMIASTPRGKRKNPLWQLIQSVEARDDAQVMIRGIDDLNAIMRAAGQPPLITDERLSIIRDTYVRRFGNDRMFNQEFHVDFGEIDASAVYGEALLRLLSDGRSMVFNLHPAHPVYVVFDIGSAGKQSDATSWIAFQWINGQPWIYDCGEGHGKPLPEYVDELRLKHWFPKLQAIILPWDAKHHEVSISETPADMMRKAFSNVVVLEKSGKVYSVANPDEITDIQATRMALYNTYIHSENCARVLECLEKFRYEYDRKKQEWKSTPLHDQYSHMMDALRYLVQSTREIDYFGLAHFSGASEETAYSYQQDWSGVWSNTYR